ncbi:hypothetical protein BOO71_0012361 [Deinococcus marmoris]|uniref:Uncharacterized protein n=1 Tax=Deinococcus marmoris TaxID=249408 RepID=A0A1U7NTL6_9DEIO|nr:hypothetical protein BOO71_0012361 [Deinococcus marmoris]
MLPTRTPFLISWKLLFKELKRQTARIPPAICFLLSVV